MEIAEIKPIVESMIFVSEEPITESALLIALGETGIDKSFLRECLTSIQNDWNLNPERGLQLVEVAGGYQFRTKESCAEWLKKLSVPKPVRLSSPALETLAIVAYKQPIIRSEVEKIRGVDSGGVLKTLLERRLLRIVGRRDEPGQPLLYGTSKEFLEVFNLSTLKELPTLRDVEDLMRERKQAQTIKEGGTAQEESSGVEQSVVDDEEPTEVISEPTDLDEDKDALADELKRYPLDADEEEEKRDMQALDELEDNMKDLRRLEKRIFPKPVEGIDVSLLGGDNGELSASEVQGENSFSEVSEGEQPRHFAEPAEDVPAGEDSPSADDSGLN